MVTLAAAAVQNNIIPTITVGELVSCGGYGTYNTVVHKMGYNAQISGTTEEDIWTQGGSYVFPPAATYPGAKMEVVSTDANDKSDGTGVQTVTIGYLTSAGVEKTEVVTLNGTTAVTTVGTDIWRINSFRAKTAGTGLKAAGSITLQELDNSPVFSSIAAGQTRARNMAYTVPAGKMLMIKDIMIASAASTVDKSYLKFTLRGNVNNGLRTTVGLEYPLWESAVAGGAFQATLSVPIYVPELVDTHMIASGNASSADAIAECEWRGCLVATS
jgi:hypothetical protein